MYSWHLLLKYYSANLDHIRSVFSVSIRCLWTCMAFCYLNIFSFFHFSSSDSYTSQSYWRAVVNPDVAHLQCEVSTVKQWCISLIIATDLTPNFHLLAKCGPFRWSVLEKCRSSFQNINLVRVLNEGRFYFHLLLDWRLKPLLQYITSFW